MTKQGRGRVVTKGGRVNDRMDGRVNDADGLRWL